MNDDIRRRVWDRDQSTCQRCHKELLEEVDPHEELVEDILALPEIPIYKWAKKCWKCRQLTDMVTYDFCLGYNYHLGDFEMLDKILLERYPFVKKVFSKTMEQEVIANVCIHCGMLQGNFFIKDDLIELWHAKVDMTKLIDMTIPNELTLEDLPFDEEELEPYKVRLSSFGHVHHIDRNRDNDELSNLVLLCRDCHVKVHIDLRE